MASRLERVSDGTLKFTIDRGEWMPGCVTSKLGLDGGVLWSESHQRGCCLGLLCRASGIPETELSGLSMPAEILDLRKERIGNEIFQLLIFEGNEGFMNEDFAESAANINDSDKWVVKTEKALTTLFEHHNIDLQFEGELYAK